MKLFPEFSIKKILEILLSDSFPIGVYVRGKSEWALGRFLGQQKTTLSPTFLAGGYNPLNPVFFSFLNSVLDGSLVLPAAVSCGSTRWRRTTAALHCTEMRFAQFPFRWIYYNGSNKSTGNETCKTHLCAMQCCCCSAPARRTTRDRCWQH